MVEEPVLARIGTSDDLTVVGHRLKHHPATIITREMAHEMRAFLIEFGMTPSARTRIEIDPSRRLPETSRAEKYFEWCDGDEMKGRLN